LGCCGRALQGKGGPVERAGREGEEGKGEKEDQIVDDDLDQRGSDEEDADGVEEDGAAEVLKP